VLRVLEQFATENPFDVPDVPFQQIFRHSTGYLETGIGFWITLKSFQKDFKEISANVLQLVGDVQVKFENYTLCVILSK